ncbi:regulator of microtubule dynamics protein 3-like [Convolutriloba macropyga]|uniref:regulator of microtubule dynamics protein 3-like n=1 Tax=Convolutriloba macropyga TaxID=536237 RepID=UPI003F5242FC
MSNSPSCALSYKQVSLNVIGIGVATTGILAISATGFYLTYNVIHEIREHSRSLRRISSSLAEIQSDIREVRCLAKNYPEFGWFQPATLRTTGPLLDSSQSLEPANAENRPSPNRFRKQSNQRPGLSAGCKVLASRDGPRYSYRSPILSPNVSDYEDAFSVIEKSKTSSEEQVLQPRKQNENEEVQVEMLLEDDVTRSKPTETFADLFKQIDELHEGSGQRKMEAYEILQEKFRDFPENPEILWRLARSLVIVAELEERQGKKEKKREILEKGCELARKCLEVNSSAEGHKWLAIISGMLGQFQSVSERIKGGFVFKEHIEKAIVLKPEDSSLHHLLGRWSFEVSQLGWVERKAASTFFGTPPSSNMNDALKCFLKANELEGGIWKDNNLWIAKCLVAMRRVDEAKAWVDQALNAESMESDDPNVMKELMAIKNK